MAFKNTITHDQEIPTITDQQSEVGGDIENFVDFIPAPTDKFGNPIPELPPMSDDELNLYRATKEAEQNLQGAKNKQNSLMYKDANKLTKYLIDEEVKSAELDYDRLVNPGKLKQLSVGERYDVPKTQQFLGNFTEAGYYIPNLLTSTATYGLQKLGAVDENVNINWLARLANPTAYKTYYGDGTFMGEISNALVYDGEKVPAVDLGSKMARTAGEFSGIGINIAGFISQAVKNAAPVFLSKYSTQGPVKNLVDNAKDAFVQPYKASVAGATGTEIGVGGLTGAGYEAGADFGRETFPDSQEAEASFGVGGAFLYGASPYSYKILPGQMAMNLVKTGFNKLPFKVRHYLKPENIKKQFSAEGRAELKKNYQLMEERAAHEEVSALLRALTDEIEVGAREEALLRAAEINKTLARLYGDDAPKLTLAEVFKGKSETLKNIQKSMEGQMGPEELAIQIARKYEALNGAKMFSNDFIGFSSPDESTPITIFNVLKNQFEPIVVAQQDARNGIKLVQEQLEGAVVSLSGSQKAEGGQFLRKTHQDMINQQNKIIDDVAENLGINTNQSLLPKDQFAQRQAELITLIGGDKGTNSLIYKNSPKIIKDLATGYETLTFQEWKKAHNLLSDQLGQELAKGKSAYVKEIHLAKQWLDDVGEMYGKVNSDFKDRFLPIWKQKQMLQDGILYTTGKKPTAEGQLIDGTPFPIYQLSDEKIALSFIKDAQSVKQFYSLYGRSADPEKVLKATTHLHSTILDDIYKNSVSRENGKDVLNPEKLRTYINQNDHIYKETPFYNDIKNVDQLSKDLISRRGVLFQRNEKIQDNQLLKFISENVTQGKKTYSQYFDEILDNPKMLGDTMEILAKQENATNLTKALQRELLTRIVGKETPEMGAFLRGEVLDMPQEQIIKLSSGFQSSLYDNLEILTNTLGKKKVEDLFLLSNMMEKFLLSPRFGVDASALQPRGIFGRLSEKLGFTESWAGARLIAYREGRVGIKTSVIAGGMKFLSNVGNKQALELFKRAFMDPDLAMRLTKPVADNSPYSSTKLVDKKFYTRRSKEGELLQDSKVKDFRFYTQSTGINLTLEADSPESSTNIESVLSPGMEEERFFSQGGEVTDEAIEPTPKEPLDFSMAYNPELLMVPIATPQQPQQGGGSPAPTGQGGQPTDFGQLFPQDAIGGAIADRAQPPMPQPPMPQQFQEGGEVKPYTEVTDEAGITTVSFPDVSEMHPAFGHDEEVARLMSMGLNLDQAIAIAKIPNKFMSAFAPSSRSALSENRRGGKMGATLDFLEGKFNTPTFENKSRGFMGRFRDLLEPYSKTPTGGAKEGGLASILGKSKSG